MSHVQRKTSYLLDRVYPCYRYQLRKRWERVLRGVVWRLPRSLVMWSTVRVILHASNGPYANQVIPELTAMEALKRWDDTNSRLRDYTK